MNYFERQYNHENFNDNLFVKFWRGWACVKHFK